MIGKTTRDTTHGEPGNVVTLPANTLVKLTPAFNLPDGSKIKYWAKLFRLRVKSLERISRTIGIGLSEDDVEIPQVYYVSEKDVADDETDRIGWYGRRGSCHSDGPFESADEAKDAVIEELIAENDFVRGIRL